MLRYIYGHRIIIHTRLYENLGINNFSCNFTWANWNLILIPGVLYSQIYGNWQLIMLKTKKETSFITLYASCNNILQIIYYCKS